MSPRAWMQVAGFMLPGMVRHLEGPYLFLRRRVVPALIAVGYLAFLREVWGVSPTRAIIEGVGPIFLFLCQCYGYEIKWYEYIYWLIGTLIKLPFRIVMLSYRMLAYGFKLLMVVVTGKYGSDTY
jgi:hypothetical protein